MYRTIDNQIKRREVELQAPWVKEDTNVGGSRSSQPGNPVENKYAFVLSDDELIRLDAIKEGIESVYAAADEDTQQIVDLLYFDKLNRYTLVKTAMETHISRSTIMRMRDKFLTAVLEELG